MTGPAHVAPIVSVVIPTYRRYAVVLDAVRSALQQTVRDIEVVVVSDGPDPEKRALIEAVDDPRLHYCEAPRTGRPGATRNAGIRRAQGSWIALLDDDDLWQPHKIERQLEIAGRFAGQPLVVSAVERETGRTGVVTYRPARLDRDPVEIQACLFSLLHSVHTSTLMARRELFAAYPMDEDLRAHEDWQWLIDVEQGARARIVVAPDVLCERRVLGDGLSESPSFVHTRSWYERNRHVLRHATWRRFILGLSGSAARARAFAAIPWLVGELASRGGASVPLYLHAAAYWVVPERTRRMLQTARDVVTRRTRWCVVR